MVYLKHIKAIRLTGNLVEDFSGRFSDYTSMALCQNRILKKNILYQLVLLMGAYIQVKQSVDFKKINDVRK